MIMSSFAGNRNNQRLSICHCSDTYIWAGDALHMSSTGRYRPRVNTANQQLWDRVLCHPHMWRHVWTGRSSDKSLSKWRHLEQDWAKVQTYVFMYNFLIPDTHLLKQHHMYILTYWYMHKGYHTYIAVLYIQLLNRTLQAYQYRIGKDILLILSLWYLMYVHI
jgi:hypothetical protein